MIVVHDGEDAEECRKTACDVSQRLGLPIDVLVSTISDYNRRQHDSGFMEWLVSRNGEVLYSTGYVPQRSPAPSRVREGSREGVEHWLKRAESDYQAALHLLNADTPAWTVVCSLAHSATEKLLKTVIVRNGRFPERSHRLSKLIPAAGRDLERDEQLVAACTLLENLYPKSRYAPNPLPTEDEARAAIDAMKIARDRLLPLLRR
jgi:HEPN domain-containing protein